MLPQDAAVRTHGTSCGNPVARRSRIVVAVIVALSLPLSAVDEAEAQQESSAITTLLHGPSGRGRRGRRPSRRRLGAVVDRPGRRQELA
jgi:hypothetical protein